ncbi:acyl-CoA thioesterase [Streptomyces sp. NPDC060205]|uniref:acyl-CoA thioesterase n=1 Tax=Streptomyces sp. NPDC060205 TaxID=3347072 RepID=UPI0036499BDB
MSNDDTAERGTAAAVGHHQVVPVHFGDLDSFGMVHHGQYAALFERGITSYWMERGVSFDRAKSQIADVLQVVRKMEITYDMPITEVGEVQVHFWIDRMGRTSYTYGFRVLSKDRAVVHATGQRIQVNLDPVTLRPTPFGEGARAAALPLMRASESPASES